MEPLLLAFSPAECVDWFLLKELVLYALLVYDMVCFVCTPEFGGFMDGGVFYFDWEMFVSDLLDNLVLLLGDYVCVAGVPVFSMYDQDWLDCLLVDYWRRR